LDGKKSGRGIDKKNVGRIKKFTVVIIIRGKG
jgi:hypothetical protein